MKVKLHIQKTLLFISIFALSFPAYSNTSNQQPRSIISNTSIAVGESTQDLAVSKVVLLGLDEENKIIPVCVADTTLYSELVPKFAKKTPEGFQSSLHFDLRSCNDSELNYIKFHADIAIEEENAQFALAPLAIGGALIICGITSALGAATGTFTAYIEGKLNVTEKELDIVQAGALSTATAIGGINAFEQATAVGASLNAATASGISGGVLGFVCGGLGTAAGYFGFKYFQE